MFRGFFFSVITLLLFFFLMVFVPAQAAGEKSEKETKKPVTTGDPYVPKEELELFVKAARNKTNTPLDVYDSVTMSAVVPFSGLSIETNQPVEFSGQRQWL